MKKVLACLCGLALASVSIEAQVLLSGGLSYSQNFDSLASTTGTSTTVPWVNNGTLTGWYLSRATSASGGTYGPYEYTSYRTDAAANSGWIYSYGSDAERALGSLGSGTPGTNAIGLRIKNDTGAAFAGDIAISLNGEQWRNGGNVNSQTILTFGYATTTDASPFSSPISALSGDPAFTPFAALNVGSPVTGATSAVVDGNTAGRVALSGVLSGITLNPGDEILFRWYDINDSGNDHGGAIDDLNIVFMPVPEPCAAALTGLGLLGIALWRRKS